MFKFSSFLEIEWVEDTEAHKIKIEIKLTNYILDNHLKGNHFKYSYVIYDLGEKRKDTEVGYFNNLNFIDDLQCSLITL